MKKYHVNRIALGLFALLFVTANVSAQERLINVPIFNQETNNTCWAACIRMVMYSYGLSKSENDIRRLAFHVADTAFAPNRTNERDSVGRLLARLMITKGDIRGNNILTPNNVVNLINSGRPIIAGIGLYRDTVLYFKHMCVIIGYRGSGDNMTLLLANPDEFIPRNNSGCQEVIYSEFINGTVDYGNGFTARWLEHVYPQEAPPAPPQIDVDKVALRTKTITAALNQITSGANNTQNMIHIWDTEAYREQVVIDSTKSNTVIVSTYWLPHALIRSPRALSVRGARGIIVIGVDIDGDSAINNDSRLTVKNLAVTAPSGCAIYNTGTLDIDYAYNRATVSAMSGDAIYNTGTLGISKATVSAASGYSAINNESGTLIVVGDTELRTASGDSGIAIDNKGINSTLSLGGSPTITGRIAGFSAGRVGVHASGSFVLTPGNKKYILDYANLKNGDIVVVNGARFIDNFELTNTKLLLTAKENNLIAASLGRFLVSKLGAMFNTIGDALLSAGSGQEIVVTDSETYEEQVTIDSTLSGITIQHEDRPLIVNPRIHHFLNNPVVTPGPAEFKRLDGNPVIGVNIEENSALRVFGTTGVLIDGIDIEGGNAVYNTGAVTIRNGTVSATSGCAIYNTGTIEIANATVSAESGYAIYNDGADGSLILGGSPVITGRIAGFYAGKVGVYTFGDYIFTPGDRKYTLSPYNLKNGDIVVAGGAEFIDNFEIDDTDFVLAANGDNLVAVALYTISVNFNERNIPAINHNEVSVLAVPLSTVTDRFTAGPIPVAKQSGNVNFFWYGNGIKNGTLRIYDALGRVVKKINVGDKTLGNSGRRVVARWDLKDAQGRVVHEGTYLAKGVFKTVGGKNEKISVVLCVK